MLEKMRQSAQGIVSWGIVLLIGISFATWGVVDYFTGGSNKHKLAAVVNGEKISWHSVDVVVERVKRQFADVPMDERALKDQLRRAVIQRTLLLSSARSLGFRVSDENIKETISKIPAFQVDGKFSKERYLEALEKAAYTDIGFRQELAQEALLGQLEQGLLESSFSLPSEMTRILTLFDQRRDFGYLILSHNRFKAGTVVSPEEVKNYYEKYQSNFVTPEQVSIEYVSLSLDQLAKQETASEEELKNYYNEHISSYSAPERVNARHILIALPKESSTEAEEAAKKKANELVAKIKKGEDFSKLAKVHSDDKGSGTKGGELGWFTRGQMVPPFETAAFGLKKAKEVSDPIRTQFGYHIIELIDKKPAETRPFAEVKNLVLEQLQREKAQVTFAEKGEKLATLAFENANSLEPIAEALGLNIEHTALFNRKGIVQQEVPAKNDGNNASNAADSKQAATTASAPKMEVIEDPMVKNPAVLTTAFSEEVLIKKNNSEPLQIGENALVVLRIKKHQPALQQTLVDVEKAIEEHLIEEQSKARTKELAESMQKKVRGGEAAPVLAAQLNLPWIVKTGMARQSSSNEMDKSILNAAFNMPYRLNDEKKHSVKAVPLNNGDYALVVLDKVIPGDIDKVDANVKNAYRQNLSEGLAQLEFSLYAQDTFKDAKIELTPFPN